MYTLLSTEDGPEATYRCNGCGHTFHVDACTEENLALVVEGERRYLTPECPSCTVVYVRLSRPDEFWRSLEDATHDCGPIVHTRPDGVLEMEDGRYLTRKTETERQEVLRAWLD